MKTTHFFFLLLLIPFLSFGQKNQSIDFVGGFDYTYRTLDTDSQEEIFVNLVEDRNGDEAARANWRVGVNYNKKLTKSIFLKTGLRLASKGYKGETQGGLRWGSQHDGMGGFDPDADPESGFEEVQINTNYWFLSIPIAARFEFNEKKWSPFVEVGLVPSIYLVTRNQQIAEEESSTMSFNEIPAGLNRIHFVGFASFGLNYTLNEKLQLFGQPSFRYHITTLADAPLDEHLYSVGIELGVRKRL